MNKLKKITIFLLSVFAAVSLFCFASCADNNAASDDQNGSNNSQSGSDIINDSGSSSGDPAATLTINSDTLSIEEDESFILIVTKSDNSEVGTVLWSSSDESVATVIDGTVTAVSEGTAVITAKAGELTATCSVSVLPSDEYPVLELSRYNAVLLIGDSAVVHANATYKGSAAKITEITATSVNEEVATVEINGTSVKINAIAYGETTITVNSSYKNKSMTRKVSVKVNEDVQFNMAEKLGLYTYSFGEFLSQKELEYSIIVKGVPQDVTAIEWSVDDESVITFENGVISAVGIGEATLSAKYVSDAGIEYNKECVVTVEKTVADLGMKAELYLTPEDGDDVLSLEELNLPDLDDLVMKNTATGETVELIPVSGGFNVDLEAGSYNVMFSSASANADFTAEITIITKVIKTLEELDNLTAYGDFVLNESNKTYTLYGFFELGADIDATDHHFVKFNGYFDFNGFDGDYGAVGLVGGFDGKGHTIYGGIYYQSGLFGSIAEGSVVRNLAINNATLPYAGPGGIIARNNCGTIDNCLVEVVAFDSKYCCISAVCGINYGTISNCVTSYPLVGAKEKDAARAICEFNSLASSSILNCYAITDDETMYNAGNGKVEIIEYPYGTKASEISVEGLSEYFDLTGDRIAFKGLADVVASIELKKENKAKAFIEDIVESDIALYNGSSSALLETVEYTDYELVDLDDEYSDNITIKNGILTVSDDADKDFTFGIKYFYTKDSAISKTISYKVTITEFLNVTVDLFVNEDMSFDVTDLDLEAGSSYSLSLEDGSPVMIENNGTKLTLSGISEGEYDVILVIDETKYQFKIVVLTAAISSYDDFCAARDSNTVDGTWSGYYILTDDIVLPDETYSSSVTSFNGTFDGRGHTIFRGTFHAGGTDPKCSLFGNLSGTLKNTAFVGQNIGILAGIAFNVTETAVIDNCLFDTLRFGNVVFDNSAPIYDLQPGGTVRNTIFYVPGGDGSKNDKGAFSMLRGNTENVYVFSTKLTGWDNRLNKTGATRFGYDTVLSNANISGLNEYFDLSGDKATFGFDYVTWLSKITKEKIDSVVFDDRSLFNGDSINIPSIEAVDWVIAYDDESFEGSVTITGNTLTVNAVKAGSFGFTLTAVFEYDETMNRSFDFDVTFIKIVEGTKYFSEGSDVEIDIINDLGAETGSEYTLKEDDKTVSFTETDGKLTINGLASGSHDLVLTIDGAIIKFKVVIVTEYITTVDQLVAFASRSNTGYYVLGANIDATNKVFNNTDATFTGTFDGNGYAIKNAYFSSANGNLPGGLFGTVAAGSVVKNLAITGASLYTELDYDWVYTSILTGGGNFCGTLEQCYIEIIAKGASTNAMGIACHINNAVIENVVLSSAVSLSSNICDQVNGNSKINNTYVIGGGATNSGWNPNNSPVTITNVSSLSAAQQATFDETIWGFDNGMPYFKKAI